jgi:hypothetical protein
MPDDMTPLHLGYAMGLLASTRAMVSTTDWNDPAHVAAAAEGVEACLGVAMSMLDLLAVHHGCEEEVRQQVEAARGQTKMMISLHQTAGRA